MTDLPEDFQFADAFVQLLEAVYTEAQVAHILAALASEGPRCFWYNPLKSCVETLGDFEPVSGLHQVWLAPEAAELTYSQAAQEGQIYFQNASSVYAARMLGAQPDEEVLDLAAAPGGKTIALAAAMGNTGRIAAVEVVKGRFHRLKANLERCGVTNVQLYLRDGRGVGRAVPERFDRVLLDAPCSSESHMRWDDASTYQHWSPRKVKECQRKQKSLLRSAYAALKPGGVLLYSTCSFSPEENELVVDHLLKRTDAEVEPLELTQDHFLPGMTTWRNKALHPDLGTTLRILPHGVWDGFYMARLKKPG